MQTTWPWDKAMRAIATDPRYEALKRVNEKKQCFNAWKVIRAKEEKEEARVKAREHRDHLRFASSEQLHSCESKLN